MSTEITREDLWVLVESFIKEKGLARLHLDSYNDFIRKGLQQIIDENKVIQIMVRTTTGQREAVEGSYIVLGKITVEEPKIREAKGFEIKLTPTECRLRGLTYAAPIMLEMELVLDHVNRQKGKFLIGYLPVMVKSDLCYLSKLSKEELIELGEDPEDPGGYFIINGSERVLIAQEDLAENRIIVTAAQKGSSATHVAKVISATPGQRAPVLVERRKDGSLYVSFAAIPTKIPLVIMLRALGLVSDGEIIEAISIKPEIVNELYVSLFQAEKIKTEDEALEYIGNRIAHGRPLEKRKEAAENVIDKNFLPHLGTTKDKRLAKAQFLAQMARKVIEAYLGLVPLDDKDHYKNKRLKLAGDLLAILFRSVFKQFIKDLQYQIEKTLAKIREKSAFTDLSNLIRADIITEKILYALATGNWVGGKTGVSQLLDRTNYLSTLSHLRRCVSPLSRTQPHFEARDLHFTQWGRICPIETPEGPNCGLVKNLALLARISVGGHAERVKEILKNKLGLLPPTEKGEDLTPVYVDGELVGKHKNAEQLVNNLRKLRRKKSPFSEADLSFEVSITLYKKPAGDEVHINTDGGRVLRPLLIVENGKLKLTKQHIEMVKRGELSWSDLVGYAIEYLDVEEEENAYIAIDINSITKEHNYAEFPTATLFGVVASIIPYAEHNHSPRNTFEAAMGKQALGLPVTNIHRAVYSRFHLLYYPQIPLVYTKPLKLIGLEKRPTGQNMVVAVLSYTGYNIQDAVIINKSSVDRGLARSLFMRLYEAEEHRYAGGESDHIEIPQPGVRGYYSHEFYSKLEDDGVILPEVEVKGGEVLIGKTSPPRFAEEFKEFGPSARRDTSVTLRHEEKGVVDTVIMTNTIEGNVLVRVRVRDERIPEIGDKFASRHGQKGVIGMLLNQEDMPFTESGIVPDLIINPHAIPSRMTVGQLLETIAGKYAALSCKQVDGTPFENVKEEFIRKELEKYGFKSTGKEVMYNGITGEKMIAEIFIGIVYYQKLHHMVSDKIHARGRGAVQILTRQPTEGRAREGGLRFGEMERDCLIAHGAAASLRDRLLEASDATYIYVCKKCNALAYFDFRKNVTTCHFCGPHNDIVKVKTAYAFKLLLQELMSMCIFPRIIVEEAVKKMEIEEEYIISGIKFGILSQEQIKKLSVVSITVPDTYDEEWTPISFGLVDKKLGTLEPGQTCDTCGGKIDQCPGHFGRIDLARPVIHIGFIKHILNSLQATCANCNRILLDDVRIEKYKKLLDKFRQKNLTLLANLVINLVIKRSSQNEICPHCKVSQPKIKFERPFYFYEERERIPRPLTPFDIYERLRKIRDDEARLLGFDPPYSRPESTILFSLPVPPIIIRPSITLETGERSEDDLTHKLGDIVRTNEKLKQSIDSASPQLIIDEHWNLLQFHVATYFDNEIAGVSPSIHRSGRPLKTLAQRLKGKEGRFRGNLSGKRVDFSARTVISPDPYISIDEVGVPYEVAKRLTIPVKVTSWNLKELQTYVINGPDNYPGANYVITPEGRQIDLRFVKDRYQLAQQLTVGYVVERHLKDGDLVLFNRQPSLHRMSMMAHRVKALPYKTFRIHPLVCPPYNADFDGDEMNLFVPQDEEAKSELEVIMKVEKQMLTPRYGGMIIGALHDYITASYLLTRRQTKLSRFLTACILAHAEYKGALDKDEYSGREIFEFFLPEINYEGKCLAVFDEEDKNLVIKKGKILKGVIDHNAIGDQKARTLLHKIYLKYGPEKTKDFLNKLGWALIFFLDHYGFTIGLDEEDLPREVYEEIEKIINKHVEKVNEYIELYRKGKLEREPGSTLEDTLEQKIIDELNLARDEAGKFAEKFFSRENSVLITAKTGARGKMLNLIHMSVCIGQQTLRGKRMYRGYEGRILPHFKKGDLGAFAKGFIKSNYKIGLNPIEFFIHAVSGREGLVDTAVRTSQSGYMQRRLINALLDVYVDYDGTVKDTEGNIIQFIYGEDGVDPAMSVWHDPVDVEDIVKEVMEEDETV